MGQPTPEAKKAWLERNPDKRAEVNRNWHLRNFYGITPEYFQEMLFIQNNQCGICHCDFINDNKPYIDHDHDTRWVRGLLCNNCNSAIGLFKENNRSMLNAISYLSERITPDGFEFKPIPNPKRKHTKEWKAEASARHKGNTYRQDVELWNKGKEWDEDTKSKMSASAIKRAASEEGKANLIVAGKLGAEVRWKDKK